MSKRELLLKKIIEATKPSTSGTKELEELGIAEQLFDEDGSFEGYDNARQYLVKDGSFCGYLFQCFHCGKYHLRVDAD